MRLAKERAASVVKNSSPSRLPAASATLPAALTMTSQQVLDLGRHFGLVDIAQVQLIGNALHEQAVGDMCSYVALADHTDLTRLVHIRILSAEFFASNHCSVLLPLC